MQASIIKEGNPRQANTLYQIARERTAPAITPFISICGVEETVELLIWALSQLDSSMDNTQRNYIYMSVGSTADESIAALYATLTMTCPTLIFYRTSCNTTRDHQTALVEYLEKEHDCKPMLGMMQDFKNDNACDVYITTLEDKTIVCAPQTLCVKSIFKAYLMNYVWHKESYKAPVTAYEKLLKGYIDEDLQSINKYLEAFFEANFIKEQMLLKSLTAFKTNKENRLQELKRRIEESKSLLENLYGQYINANRTLNEYMDLYNSINEKDDTVDLDKIKEYIANSKYFKLISNLRTNNDTITMLFKAPILDYDPDYVTLRSDGRQNTSQKILKIFLKRERFQLWTACALQFVPSTGMIRNDTGIALDNTVIGHPHLYRFGCTGNHPDKITAFTNQGNFIGAMNAITAMVFNLNFRDGTVIDAMLTTLKNDISLPTWKDLKTGKFISTEEVLEIMEEEYGEA